MKHVEREECGGNPNAKMDSNPSLSGPLVISSNHASLSVNESVSFLDKILTRSSMPSENIIAPCMVWCFKMLSLVAEKGAIQSHMDKVANDMLGTYPSQ